MKKMSRWHKPAAMLSLFAIAAGTVQISAIAQGVAVTSNTRQNAPSSASQIAQATASLCRKVTAQEGLVIREKPSLTSRQVGSAPLNSQITLVEAANVLQASDGRLWVEISSPVRGYISNGYANSQSNLGTCSGTANNPPQNPPAGNGNTGGNSGANLCRQVEPRVAPRGLAVRADASAASAYRGGVPANSKVTLVQNYKLVLDKSGQNRNWVEITSPVAGFVSAQSLIMCR
ncbi:MAG TPA: SH3 domain-containing protein [Kamptonema sp.]|nr:SH3 domain-containing protein [Kamptonema sp.]